MAFIEPAVPLIHPRTVLQFTFTSIYTNWVHSLSILQLDLLTYIAYLLKYLVANPG